MDSKHFPKKIPGLFWRVLFFVAIMKFLLSFHKVYNRLCRFIREKNRKRGKMIELPITSVRQKIVAAGTIRGLSQKEAEFLAGYYLDADMRGAKTHGVGRFLVESDSIKTRGGPPRTIKETSISAFVDAQRDLGALAAQFCIDLLIPKVKTNGFGIVALKNASRYSQLTPFGSSIASFGFVGIVTNSAGPAAVSPHGSYSPILGTNPLCIALPTGDGFPIVMDFATSQSVWGEIRQAMLEGRNLVPRSFYTQDGSFAVRPEEAAAVKAFDEAKGFALCLAIEVLCGAFLGLPMGLAVNDEYDLGFLFIGIDPKLFRDNIEGFYSELSGLAGDIRNAAPLDINQPVRLPGDKSNKMQQSAMQSGKVKLEEKTWDLLCRMAENAETGMESSFLTN